MSKKTMCSILIAAVLCLQFPQTPAHAGFRGGDVAAGMVGAMIGAAIIAQRSRAGSYYARPHARTKSSGATARAESKDPFAGASAPADYAKPVSSH
jgi:hypothetical protein